MELYGTCSLPSLPSSSSLWAVAVASKDLPGYPGYLGLRHLGLVAAGAMLHFFLAVEETRVEGCCVLLA